MLNGLIVSVALASILLAAFSGQMQALTDSILSSARNAVDLAIGLVGIMAFFLGLFRIAEDAGLLRHLARLVGPMLHRLFPSVPVGSPAMSAMILNISSNMLGLGNAATPFGIKAMEELDKLNSKPGTATNAMVLFLAINTSALAILPSGAVGMRASVGSEDAMGIFIPTWFASGCATLVGITAAVLLSRLWIYRSTEPAALTAADTGNMADAADYAPLAFDAPEALAPKPVRRWLGRLFWLVLAGLLARFVWDSRTRSTVNIITGVTFEQ